MTRSTYGWRAQVRDDFLAQRDELLFARNRPDAVEVVVFDGVVRTELREPGITGPPGIVLPGGCWAALAALAAPMADAGEVGALRDALAAERLRVDALLVAATRYAWPMA